MDYAILIDLDGNTLPVMYLCDDEFELVKEWYYDFIKALTAIKYAGKVQLVKVAPENVVRVEEQCTDTYEKHPWLLDIISQVFGSDDPIDLLFPLVPLDFNPEWN